MNDIISHESLERIKALAQKATPGQWIQKVRPKISVGDDATFITTEARESEALFEIARLDFTEMYSRRAHKFSREQRANASFIAATDPGTVIALCKEIERLREQVTSLEKEAEFLAEVLSHHECPGENEIGFETAEAADKHCAGRKSCDSAACWREAARKAVEGAA